MTDRFLRAEEVFKLVGIGRSFCYELIKRGEFPAPVKLGPQVSVWSANEIAQWQLGRLKNRTHVGTHKSIDAGDA